MRRMSNLQPQMTKLQKKYENDKEKARKLSQVMARMAEMISGVEIEDPAAFVSLVAEMF